MLLIIGLGNPGKEYENTRHNIGFKIVDSFAEKNDFPAFQESSKHQSLISEKTIHNKKVILLKPQTFMNLSGKAVKSVTNFYKLNPTKDIIVIGDDADLKIGKINIQSGKSSAGHKGVQSIINELGTKEFIRMRIGIDSNHEIYRTIKKESGLEGLVLMNFLPEEELILLPVIEESNQALNNLINS